jgi:CheY-like chemotaxis protein
VAEAVRLLADRPIDLVVCDIGMPKEDGFDFIRHLRSRSDGAAEVPAVALTAYAREEDRDRALAAGFQAHIAKPFDADNLVAELAAIVDAWSEGKD